MLHGSLAKGVLGQADFLGFSSRYNKADFLGFFSRYNLE
jgi:hypothetical protein